MQSQVFAVYLLRGRRREKIISKYTSILLHSHPYTFQPVHLECKFVMLILTHTGASLIPMNCSQWRAAPDWFIILLIIQGTELCEWWSSPSIVAGPITSFVSKYIMTWLRDYTLYGPWEVLRELLFSSLPEQANLLEIWRGVRTKKI